MRLRERSRVVVGHITQIYCGGIWPNLQVGVTVDRMDDCGTCTCHRRFDPDTAGVISRGLYGTESERLIVAHDLDNKDNISHIFSYFG
jgi:hypothetical protein